ncbi:MAG TPA: hypothetical protein PKC03_16870 [Dokdonella sp.]|jgi:hypothetical protein|nr:hypothetical protein [Dokdonella sp.]
MDTLFPSSAVARGMTETEYPGLDDTQLCERTIMTQQAPGSRV